IRAECADILARYNGKLVHLLGPSLLVYFGYPEASEDDVERAILASLDLVRAIGALKDRLRCPLRLGVGIATGPVVIGDPDAGGSAAGIAGGALTLAMQLRSAAPADGVVIGEDTRALAGGLFKYRKLRPLAIEDGAAPVGSW